MDWEETGKRAFYSYFYMYDKTIDHDVSQESASGEIEGSMEDAGIEIENLWYEELPVEAWVGVCKGYADAYKNVEKEVGYEVSEEFMGPAHTWFSDCMFHSNELHSDLKLEKLIEDFNKI